MRLCVATMAAECFAAGARHGHFCKKTPGLIVTINCDMNILNTNYAEYPLDVSSSSRRLIFRTFCVACLRSPPPSRGGGKCKRIKDGWISPILYLFSHFSSDSDSNTDRLDINTNMNRCVEYGARRIRIMSKADISSDIE